jgi:hypothetical protein
MIHSQLDFNVHVHLLQVSKKEKAEADTSATVPYLNMMIAQYRAAHAAQIPRQPA